MSKKKNKNPLTKEQLLHIDKMLIYNNDSRLKWYFTREYEQEYKNGD